MSESAASGWRDLARHRGIDPDEVRLVYTRYAAQHRHAQAGQREPLPLDRWFRFYVLEKSSEGRQAGPAPGACSIGSDAVNDACIERPRAFLEVLAAYAREERLPID
ncbi:MAG: hypothetical protein D6727_04265 [Gammaproteobacteria bacterium]|nr:MAG: hypothetical protein D6727_04265 [Gammaproteobacteria bacterium]